MRRKVPSDPELTRLLRQYTNRELANQLGVHESVMSKHRTRLCGKPCPNCGNTKQAKAFRRDRGKKSGLQSWCVECVDISGNGRKIHFRGGGCTYANRLTTTNPDAVTCRFCLKGMVPTCGLGRLTCEVCGVPYRDHPLTMEGFHVA